MLIGLDVGGTHTDAVLLRPDSGDMLAWFKAPTRQDDVLPGIVEALAGVLGGHDPKGVRRVSVSSTLGINALLTGKNDPAAMLALPGPGIDPRLFWGDDPLFEVLGGAQDHRGLVVAAPRKEDISQAFRRIAANKARAIGVVCKFSPKNPALEREIGAMARAEFGPDMPVVLGSSVSGSLNFPRRMRTAWCNATLARVSKAFIHALEQAVRGMGLFCPLVVLKADAGVFPASRAASDPAGSMGSGPAASLLGAWALTLRAAAHPQSDMLMIDMGGTSTDLALTAAGSPLIAPQGLTVQGGPTLIRSLRTRSLALGGDSSLRLDSGAPVIGPDRSGPALALSAKSGHSPETRPPTLTDALNVLGLTRLGDPALSHAALEKLARGPGSPAPDAQSLARMFMHAALDSVRDAYCSLLQEVNAQPVYTIRELLINEPITPAGVVFIGGPAAALAREAERILELPVFVPEESCVANALGAALAKPTRTADLYADTLSGRMSIPDFGLEKSIGRGYTPQQAEADLRAAFAGATEKDPLMAEYEESGQNLHIVNAETFAMIDDQGGRGRVIRMRAQQPPGLLYGGD